MENNNNNWKSKLNLALLAIDLDGTLLTPYKKITKKDLESLKKYSDLGGEIFISTGKSLDATKVYIQKIMKYIGKPLKYCSCLNGNIIYDITENKIIHSSLIKNEICKKIYQIAKKNRVIFAPYTVDGMTMNTILISHSKAIPPFLNKLNLIFRFKFMKRYQKMDAFKINLLSYSKKRMKNEKFENELNNVDEIEVLKTSDKLYEIVKKGSNKASALEIVCNKLNLNLVDVGAIGDSHNDLPMFKIAGKAFMVRERTDDVFLKFVDVLINDKKNKVSKIINNYVIKSIN